MTESEALIAFRRLPTAFINKMVRELHSWGNESAGGSGREVIKHGPHAGEVYGQIYYDAALAIETLYETNEEPK